MRIAKGGRRELCGVALINENCHGAVIASPANGTPQLPELWGRGRTATRGQGIPTGYARESNLVIKMKQR